MRKVIKKLFAQFSGSVTMSFFVSKQYLFKTHPVIILFITEYIELKSINRHKNETAGSGAYFTNGTIWIYSRRSYGRRSRDVQSRDGFCQRNYTSPYRPIYNVHTLSIIISLLPQVNSAKENCENRWGGKEFTWGDRKIFARFALEKIYRPRIKKNLCTPLRRMAESGVRKL